MAFYLRLTRDSGQDVYVNVNQLLHFAPASAGGTELTFVGGTALHVSEDAEQIATLIGGEEDEDDDGQG
jgi:hypothetical protein